jgi:hypothetical protein
MTIPTEPGFYWMRSKAVDGIEFRWRTIEVFDDCGELRMVDDSWHDVRLSDCEWGERLPSPDEPEDLGKIEIPRWLRRRSSDPKDQVFVLKDIAHDVLVDGLDGPSEIWRLHRIFREWNNWYALLGEAFGFEPAARPIVGKTSEAMREEAQALADAWTYPDRAHLKIRGPDNWLLVLSTGGWSENESLIHNTSLMFHSLCWISSRKGGHFIYGRGPLGDVAWEALMNTTKEIADR